MIPQTLPVLKLQDAVASNSLRPKPRYGRWQVTESSPLAASLAASARIPLMLAELLASRGVKNAEDAAAFLSPSLDQLADPYSMLGMQIAVDRIISAIAARELILIYGDYDVDGTTAIVLLKTALEMLGGQVRFHIPHRIRDGYGMQAGVLSKSAVEGVRLVISVDTGIRAYAAAEEAERLGLDLIVTDHHLPDASAPLPRALAILNPNQAGCGYHCKFLCGAGVAFKLAQALLEAQDKRDGTNRARTKILPSFLKILVLATVADAVPLLGENRIFASVGIEQLKNPVNPGLKALMEVAQLDPVNKPLTATDIGFRLAPRINAAGRMDIASDVVDLFTNRDPAEARRLAEKLEGLNQDRRNTELEALTEIERMLAEDASFASAKLIVIAGRGWHRGVIGILASRVVERTGKPALVMAYEDNEAYGSGRSIEGFHLLDALESSAALFTRFGGHTHAVGFSLAADRVETLRAAMERYAERVMTPEVSLRTLHCHGELALAQITPVLFAAISRLQPTGTGNPEPVFVARQLILAAAPRLLKERHIKLQLTQVGLKQKASFPALGWSMAERSAELGLEEGSVVDVAYSLRHNAHPEYGGLELEIVDLCLSAAAGS